MLNSLLSQVYRFIQFFRILSKEDRMLISAIRQLVGKHPLNLNVYKLAFSHISASRTTPLRGLKESNERLEYLGDALLGAIVAEYLFKKFPFEDEGFLTEIRSRIVNRESLNQLARKIGLDALIRFEGSRKSKFAHRSLNGDALEALIGAVFLDWGFGVCKHFVLHKLIYPHFNISEVVSQNKNFKSILLEWAQRENKEIRFEIISEKGASHQKEFIAQVIIDKVALAKGSGYSKKKAEQSAAEKCCELLKLSE